MNLSLEHAIAVLERAGTHVDHPTKMVSPSGITNSALARYEFQVARVLANAIGSSLDSICTAAAAVEVLLDEYETLLRRNS